MAASHKKLSSGQLASSTGNIYDPSSVTGMVKTILLHNTSGSSEVSEVYFNGTASSDRLLKATLEPDETLEWALDHMLVVEDAQVLKGESTNATSVNYFIFGAEE